MQAGIHQDFTSVCAVDTNFTELLNTFRIGDKSNPKAICRN